MNNSKIAFYNVEEQEPDVAHLEEKRGETSQIVEAISRVEAHEDWQKLKRLVLDEVVSSLERRLLSKASDHEVNLPEVYRLQGQLEWARKYVDLKKLADSYRNQLEHIKYQLKNE